MKPRLDTPATGVIVTGGASGLGHASAEALAAVGRPVSLWDLDVEKASGTAKALHERYGVVAEGIAVDVRDPEALRTGAERARAHLPNIGGLVHAAGSPRRNGTTGSTSTSGRSRYLPENCCRTWPRTPALRSSPSRRSTQHSETP